MESYPGRSFWISNLPHLLVEGSPPTMYCVSMGPCQGRVTGPQGAALAVDESTLREVLNNFAQPELKIKMVDHFSPFRVPPNIY